MAAPQAGHHTRLFCAGLAWYFEDSRESVYYTLERYHELWEALRSADEVITWNGNRVALLVLRRLFGAEHFPIKREHVGVAWGKHIDLCTLIEQQRRLTHRISLAKAVEFTFGERRLLLRPSGRVRAEELHNRCERFAAQTLRLWQAYRGGEGIALGKGPSLFHPQNQNCRSQDGFQ